jgi:hypothetical protein
VASPADTAVYGTVWCCTTRYSTPHFSALVHTCTMGPPRLSTRRLLHVALPETRQPAAASRFAAVAAAVLDSVYALPLACTSYSVLLLVEHSTGSQQGYRLSLLLQGCRTAAAAAHARTHLQRPPPHQRGRWYCCTARTGWHHDRPQWRQHPSACASGWGVCGQQRQGRHRRECSED